MSNQENSNLKDRLRALMQAISAGRKPQGKYRITDYTSNRSYLIRVWMELYRKYRHLYGELPAKTHGEYFYVGKGIEELQSSLRQYVIDLCNQVAKNGEAQPFLGGDHMPYARVLVNQYNLQQGTNLGLIGGQIVNRSDLLYHQVQIAKINPAEADRLIALILRKKMHG